VTPDPSRRGVGGLIAAGSVVVLIVAGAALALVLSRGGGGHEAGPGAGVLPTAPASAPAATTRQSTRARTQPVSSAGSWPVGASGYTVVVATLAKHGHRRAAAERIARAVVAPGLTARVLDSTQHPLLRPNVWIVYVGRYSTRPPADRTARQLVAAGTRRGVVERLTG
jgi:hypothetical protein